MPPAEVQVTIRLGQIEYANCTPIFTALTDTFDCSGYSFVRGVPSELNRLLRQGDIDLCPSSSIEYAKSPGTYCLLPDLSISSKGKVKSVCLFSRLPIEELNGLPIGLTTESDTSVNLLKILLHTMYGFDNLFVTTPVPFDEALREFPAVLLIGDRALRATQDPKGARVYDLGELWYRFTGFPFVFALWIANRQTVERSPDAMLHLSDSLAAAKVHAYRSYGDIAARCAERSWMTPEALVDYWQTISYDLTPAHLQGLRLFFRYAAELGVIEREPQIDLITDVERLRPILRSR